MSDFLLARVEHFGHDMFPSRAFLVEQRQKCLEIDELPLWRINLDSIVEDIHGQCLVQIVFDIRRDPVLTENPGQGVLPVVLSALLIVAFLVRHSIFKMINL